MRAADLAAEMRAAAIAMELRDFAQLREMGVTRMISGVARVRGFKSCQKCGMLSHGHNDADCEASYIGLYEPEDSPWGHWRWITPVWVQWPDTPESSDHADGPLRGQLIDLVAWPEANPEDWILRIGQASWLGAIEPQYLNPAPVQVWRSPLSWMRGGCTGLVPLCRDRSEVYSLLMHCSGGVRAEDRVHAAQLRHILEYPVAHPPVSWRVQ